MKTPVVDWKKVFSKQNLTKELYPEFTDHNELLQEDKQLFF